MFLCFLVSLFAIMANEEQKLIGKVTHYYGKVGVAIIKLEGLLKAGDKVRFAGNKEEFEQMVDSIEIDRQKVDEAQAGQEVGVKVEKKVSEGTPVYLL